MSPRPHFLLASAMTALQGSAIAANQVTVVDRPASDVPVVHYAANRPPLSQSPLIKLPIGAIRPGGWLERQLVLQADGFHGHLGEISAFLRKDGNAWLSADGQGKFGWEEVPYWLKGFGDCAYLLGREDQIAEAKVWIEGALASQGEDGYFGPRGEGAKPTVSSTSGKYDLWANMIMLFCLQSWSEFNGDPRVLEFMGKYFRWQMTVADEDFLPPYWQHQRGADNLSSVYWLYNRTGEQWLLELAEKVHRNTANWTDGIPNWHNVNMSQAFGGPTLFGMQSGEPTHLEAADRNFRTIRRAFGQVPGGMFGGDENCRPGFTDPRQAVETCGMVEMMLSCERLLAATGAPVWADRCEDVAYNSLPAALTADLKALRYLTAPNMAVSDQRSHNPGIQNGGPMFHMNPHDHRCCQHNVGHGWPYFAEHLWMATPDGGLAAVFYPDCDLTARVGADAGALVSLATRTRYPFDEKVAITLTMPQSIGFPLYLRIPGWCAAPTIAVNGAPLATEARPLAYVRIQRQWNDGDRVDLVLPMRTSTREWADNHHSVSVDRGPLTYSLAIGEDYRRAGGSDRWPAFEILPTSAWNYGLVSREAEAFEVETRAWPEDDMPFTAAGAPVRLHTRGRRVPEWQLDRFGLVAPLQDSPVKSSEPVEPVTLIPMGAARLRLASFPVIGEGVDAHQWEAPPTPHPWTLRASHTWRNDSIEAVKDRILPRSSGDQEIPRFTWWDHRGGREWIECAFENPRDLSAVEVYWFDDTGVGQCRLPARWHVLYKAEAEWLPVPAPHQTPVAPDTFNATRFDPVRTDAVRIEVELQPQFSGGILEIRFPD